MITWNETLSEPFCADRGTLNHAIYLATAAHSGQLDKSDQPYILHPLRVMLSLESETERVVGVLHDVIEDTQTTMEQLQDAGFSDEVIQAIDAISRRHGETYLDYIHRCGQNEIARRVKLADLADNLNRERISNLNPTLVDRYLRVQGYLLGIGKEE